MPHATEFRPCAPPARLAARRSLLLTSIYEHLARTLLVRDMFWVELLSRLLLMGTPIS